MQKKKFFLVVFAAVMLVAVSIPHLRSAQNGTKDTASTLSLLNARSVDRIDVMLIDERTSFRIEVTKDFIERNYDVKYSVQGEYVTSLLTLINDQIPKAKDDTVARSYDFRYAIILFDDKNTKLQSIYIDPFNFGLINEKPVQFNPAFRQLLSDWHPSINKKLPSPVAP